MKKILNFLASLLPDKSDTLLFSGLSFLFWGVYQINIPNAFIIVGCLLMVIALLPLLPKRS